MIALACPLLASVRLPWPPLILCLLLVLGWATTGHGMTDDTISTLRQDTRDLFYHGYINYLAHAFPEDELRPISCKPQTRNRDNPADIGLNDVLGNYSLTLIDSLSTLAILASGEQNDGHNALLDFQRGVQALVELYGDGRNGSCGSRACGFDLDSKVQVFETTIRGVGGLLSAHLFAVGELPIRSYTPVWKETKGGDRFIDWNSFAYDGQLLRLAHDLASRLLPAFDTETNLPYPRVNLRHGIPFYRDAEEGICRTDGTSSDPREITETCAAGAGSLVLEFATLSRLTGDDRFEDLAERAFWAVWNRRSAIGLIGNGLDAESGQWTMPPLAGIGAGTDSFFEYALKSHILLSGSESSPYFLSTWQNAHAAVKRHVYRGAKIEKHPFYAQADLITGAPRYTWVDNLSAYYPGLLTLAGELDEAIEAHLLYAALWTRYSALPERWHIPNAYIDPSFKHWSGRPEFIESTYYLYQATKDPWYLHVGEMTLRDIRRRCWTKCGWADLGDVVSGEQRDRMESFFLGETAKYLYLLFEPEHPLNKIDASVVFSTEGHPLIIPRTVRKVTTHEDVAQSAPLSATCPIPAPALPLTGSNIANRHDLFHAAALAQLHLVPVNPARSSPLLEASHSSPGISLADIRSPTNYTFYPWTLPSNLIPTNGMSSPIASPRINTLTFPNLNPKDGSDSDGAKGMINLGALQKVLEGVLINSLSNIRLNMVQEPKYVMHLDGEGMLREMDGGMEFRVQAIANWALGRDEKVLVSNEAIKGVSPADPHFTRVKDAQMIDLVIDVPATAGDQEVEPAVESQSSPNLLQDLSTELELNLQVVEDVNGTIDEGVWEDIGSMLVGLLSRSQSHLAAEHTATVNNAAQPTLIRTLIPAILPTGDGAAPLPAAMDDSEPTSSALGSLPYQNIFFLDDTLCTHTLPASIADSYHILVLKRGGCSFNDKLANIPSFSPTSESLQLVVVLSMPTRSSTSKDSAAGLDEVLIRPLLDDVQRTPEGAERRFAIAMCMIHGSEKTVNALVSMAADLGNFDADGKFIKYAGIGMSRHGAGARPGLGVKRRIWFESMGVPIGNLIVV